MTGPIPLPKQYPAHLQLCYRGVRYRPAALQLFVARGGWGREFIPLRRHNEEAGGLHSPAMSQLPVIAMPLQRRAMPDASVLWDRFDYKPLTGELVSKRFSSRGGQKAKYLLTSIHTEDGNHRFLTHRAIWKWVHGIEPEMTIDHINRDPRDNRVWNLRHVPYTTQLRNHGGCRLTVDKVRAIKRRLTAGEMQKVIAADYGVNPATISDISRGRRWREVEAG